LGLEGLAGGLQVGLELGLEGLGGGARLLEGLVLAREFGETALEVLGISAFRLISSQGLLVFLHFEQFVVPGFDGYLQDGFLVLEGGDGLGVGDHGLVVCVEIFLQGCNSEVMVILSARENGLEGLDSFFREAHGREAFIELGLGASHGFLGLEEFLGEFVSFCFLLV